MKIIYYFNEEIFGIVLFHHVFNYSIYFVMFLDEKSSKNLRINRYVGNEVSIHTEMGEGTWLGHHTGDLVEWIQDDPSQEDNQLAGLRQHATGL